MYANNHLLSQLSAAAPVGKTFATRPGLPDVTYGDLFAGAERMAATLARLGVAPGDRVAVQVSKSIEAIQLYLGTVMAGGVFLPLNTAYTGAELTYFFGDATPTVIVCDPARLDEITPLSGGASVLTLAGDGSGTLTEESNAQLSVFNSVSRSPDDLAAILYTSGTTGRSKGAMLSHNNLSSNSATLRDYWKFTPDDVLIHALPIFHTHGLFVATNVALLAGASVHFLPGFDADAIIKAMPTSTSLMGVPTFYTRLLDHPGLTPEATQSMRLFISGSAPLLVETHERWEAKTGHRILERYGMTETNMSTSNPYNGERCAGTVGFPLPSIELRIMQDGKEVPNGEIGVLEVRGPNVFQGYWKMPEKTAEELRADGWFITGDQGLIDDRGYVTIVGREKDMVITGGFNVYPKEIESLIDDISGVKESAVIGLPHPDFGEGIVAVIVRDDEALIEDHIAFSLEGQVARFKQPKAIKFLPELPRNTMGKVQKKALREQFKDLFAS
ncbi:malonyl-CoA synthase [Roseovarius sp. EL26]|uniref:malonate--CoA ligase n=1 Tax=Roseovarius sp. EL26 TaxID=2126672 RepID=UPI000EA2A7DC|nr:malonyl-CoA synthase [Roseovarius sp. EL26]